VTTIERAFRWKGRVHPSHPQPGSRGYPERVRMSALEFRLAETLGGTAKPGWSPRKGQRLSPFLGASRVAIRPISRFFFQLRIRSSCLAGASGVCSWEPRRKLYGSQSWRDHRTGRPQMTHPVYVGRDHETHKGKYHNRTIQSLMRDRQVYLTRKLREGYLGRDLEGPAVRG
jgi:hypothetical protein